MKVTKKQPTSGSVFFLIFFAIALFAAVSYAVLQGSRVGGATLTKEQSRLAAQEIIAFSDALANTVQTLRLRGCADTQFDFSNTSWLFVNGTYLHNTGHNPSAPTTGCSVFKSDGNLASVLFNLSYFDTNVSVSPTSTAFGSSNIRKIALAGVGSSELDMAYLIPYVKNEVCIEINKILGVNANNFYPSHTISGAGPFLYDGNYSTTRTLTHDVANMDGKSSFCGLETGQSNRFYRVLIAR